MRILWQLLSRELINLVMFFADDIADFIKHVFLARLLLSPASVILDSDPGR